MEIPCPKGLTMQDKDTGRERDKWEWCREEVQNVKMRILAKAWLKFSRDLRKLVSHPLLPFCTESKHRQSSEPFKEKSNSGISPPIQPYTHLCLLSTA